jgi:hypothetical protein
VPRTSDRIAGATAFASWLHAHGEDSPPPGRTTSHYFRARLPDQSDAVIHINSRSALEALERWTSEARAMGPDGWEMSDGKWEM